VSPRVRTMHHGPSECIVMFRIIDGVVPDEAVHELSPGIPVCLPEIYYAASHDQYNFSRHECPARRSSSCKSESQRP
jgi:hypothetical protein